MELAGAEGYRWLIGTDSLLLNRLLRDLVFTDQDRT